MKPGMYYLGLGLVLIGLLSLLVLFLTVSIEKKAETSGRTAGPEPVMPMHQPQIFETPRPTAPPPQSMEPEAMAPSFATASIQSAASPAAPILAEGRPLRLREPEQIVVFGALFLDHARNLSVYNTKNPEELPPRIFADFKRVGKGSLVCEANGFMFKSGHAVYNYPVGDLEQIVFLATGLALLPGSVKSPIAIFLTDESDRVRDFIRENSV